jgi:hypothetical protein
VANPNFYQLFGNSNADAVVELNTKVSIIPVLESNLSSKINLVIDEANKAEAVVFHIILENIRFPSVSVGFY